MRPLRRLYASTDRWSARRLVVGSQAVLGLTMLVCLALMPRFLFSSNMGGSSNYGVHARTVLPYTVGIVVSALLLLRAARVLIRQGNRRLGIVAGTSSVLILVDLLSTYPYKLSGTLSAVHYGCGVVLAVGELIGAIVVVRLQRDPAGHVAVAVMLAGFLALVLTFFGALHVLFAAELTTAAAFGAVLIRATTPSALRSDFGALPVRRTTPSRLP